MTTTPDGTDFARGFDYSFGGVFGAAWRRCRRNWGMAVISLFLVAMTCVGIRALLWLVMLLVAVLAPQLFAGEATAVSWDIAYAVAGIVFCLPLFEGYLWSLVRSYDRDRVIYGEVFQVWKRPWRRPIMILCLVIGGLGWLGKLAAAAIGPMINDIDLTGHFAMFFGDVLGEVWIAEAFYLLIALVTLFVAPAMLTSREPSLIGAWRQHFRVLRYRPLRMLTSLGLLLAATAAAMAPLHLLLLVFQTGSGLFSSLGEMFMFFLIAVILWIVALMLYVFQYFFTAAVYRAAHGLSLEPSQATSKHYYGVSVGAIKRRRVPNALRKTAAEREAVFGENGPNLPPAPGDDQAFDPGAFLPETSFDETDPLAGLESPSPDPVREDADDNRPKET